MKKVIFSVAAVLLMGISQSAQADINCSAKIKSNFLTSFTLQLDSQSITLAKLDGDFMSPGASYAGMEGGSATIPQVVNRARTPELQAMNAYKAETGNVLIMNKTAFTSFNVYVGTMLFLVEIAA